MLENGHVKRTATAFGIQTHTNGVSGPLGKNKIQEKYRICLNTGPLKTTPVQHLEQHIKLLYPINMHEQWHALSCFSIWTHLQRRIPEFFVSVKMRRGK